VPFARPQGAFVTFVESFSSWAKVMTKGLPFVRISRQFHRPIPGIRTMDTVPPESSAAQNADK